MIIGKIVIDETALVIRQLEESSEFKFYLTGSRFFEEPNEQSDWDFFVESGYNIEEWLEAKGFMEVPKRKGPNYMGPGAEHIIRIVERANVQIQLVENAPLKSTIQQILKKQGVMIEKDKVDRKRLWAFAYSLAEELKNVE